MQAADADTFQAVSIWRHASPSWSNTGNLCPAWPLLQTGRRLSGVRHVSGPIRVSLYLFDCCPNCMLGDALTTERSPYRGTAALIALNKGIKAEGQTGGVLELAAAARGGAMHR
jgi:hypothetical protein